jgi:uncharacterized protein with von Willebrand factor type A (vWA) domain
MRTTLDIDADVLQVAKELAALDKRTAGAVLSELARRGIHAPEGSPRPQAKVRNGIEMLSRRGEQVTLAHVRSLLDEEGI